MNFVIDAFEPAFMQRALIGGLIAVVATSLVGTWIVLRGLAFLGDALAHGVIPGVALAVLWGFSPALGACISAIDMSGLVSAVANNTSVREDTAIGLLFFIEGLFLAIFPSRIKNMLEIIKNTPENKLRSFGLFFLIIGFLIIWYIKN